jgi:hypothetical protein
MRMGASTRKKLGVAVMVASLAAGVALYVSGTPLVSVTSWQTDSVAIMAFHLRWPFLAVCCVGLFGLGFMAWPQRRPPRIQQ